MLSKDFPAFIRNSKALSKAKQRDLWSSPEFLGQQQTFFCSKDAARLRQEGWSSSTDAVRNFQTFCFQLGEGVRTLTASGEVLG